MVQLLIDLESLNKLKSRDLVPIKCEQCLQPFFRKKHLIQVCLINPTTSHKFRFCSRKCQGLTKRARQILECPNCKKTFYRHNCDVNKTKLNFCSRPCSGFYYSQNKTSGSKRSKLEKWLEEKLNAKYPNLTIKFNNVEAIQAELDIYLPDLKVAFELNGIFHYEPIFGPEKLKKTQNNDKRKFQACLEHGIELCIIDTSKHRYFKEKSSFKILEIIELIINNKLNGTSAGACTRS